MQKLHGKLCAIACIVLGILAANGVSGAAVMSVDFGCEWMKVAVVSPGVPMEIALNKESKRKTASMVAFRDGIRIFGEDAQNIGVRFPQNSYGYFLDLLGKSIDNPVVELYRKRFPYYKIEADPKRNTVVFRVGDDVFSVEELVAQLLQKAKEFAESTAEQKITECVIVTPGYFGQAERAALIAAASLANLKVLQLMNDYTAVGLNYGVFRKNQINETAQYYVFYDMGAYKTSAAVVSFQLVKDKTTRETNPVISVLGVGYDRTLGGLEMQLRLRDHLAREFNKMKKTKTDVFTNPRALAKLFKEAGRVKNVLSANANHYAQIEALLDDQDFKVQVTREQFEGLCTDLFERVPHVINRALTASGLSMDVVTQVILFGGGTRVPKVQEILKNTIKQDLGKNLNSDEAAAMGAVYRAADLATGFRVQKFLTKDAVVLPIQVVFEREGDSGSMKQVKRTLFGPMNPYPQKKVITFNKHTSDFTFDVNYSELDHLDKGEIPFLGSLNLSRVALSQVGETLKEHLVENVESKGIKAHFAMDDSGIFALSGVELVYEKSVTEAAEEDDESPLSKLGSTISKLFSSEKSEKEETQKEDSDKEETTSETQSEESKPVNETQEIPATSESAQEKTEPKDEEAQAQNKTEKPRIVTVKQAIPSDVTYLFTQPLTEDLYQESKKKIDALDELERQRTRRETALNALESFVIEANQRMDQNEYSSCALPEEIEKIQKSCAETSDWLYEDGSDADAKTYEEKLKELKKLTNDVYARHWEHTERPEALKALKGMLDGAEKFLKSARNLTKDANAEKDVFTAVEIETLEKAIRETAEWRQAEEQEQKKLARNDAIRLTVKSIADKMALLDREVKYLVNKLKIWKPKLKEKKAKSNETEKKESEEEEVIAEEEQTGKDEDGPQIEEPEVPVDDGEKSEPPHGEL
ncbi:hypoxia up-regulated protein 1 [Phlebotomus argentipes]|uniref:hypoxia up-regulated protein 1 n=1 Tax=Phlebotomus argentipes TaxID=94469 RepID=UPI002893409C|nr:hypoxia up-regulated protein 1 [Phlebotomus argentipes]XP_059619438.1 hypoxia up-regulated protein 1 [Phlebotomus argentipes]XP_059619439.1 hypoxia up-regulated protein 1 [Phlebotomus argentipes]